MTNSPLTAEQVHELAGDSCQELLRTLGLVLKTTAEGHMPYRGPRSTKPKTREEKCKGWLHGSLKEKDEHGQRKFTSIVDRYQKDPGFVTAFNEEMQK